MSLLLRSTLSVLICYPNQVHTPSNLKTLGGFYGSLILRNRPLEFPTSIILDKKECRKCIVCRELFDNSQILHECKEKCRQHPVSNF